MATLPRNAAVARKAAPARIRGKILVLHGPNLNLLGTREPAVYGRGTLTDIDARLAAQAKAGGVAFAAFQSNHEGALIDRVHAAVAGGVGFIVIDPAGVTHGSVALRDALSGVAIPLIEVHLSNVHAREPLRHHSYFSDKAVGDDRRPRGAGIRTRARLRLEASDGVPRWTCAS